MLAAKSEAHATGATLLFNAAHYALRPWPWILVGLASLVLYPDLDSLAHELPNVSPDMVRDDLAYPAALSRLPTGLLGLVTTSLVAAYMSTISTQLNWGSSYVVNDLWLRFIRPDANERELVTVGRVTTVILMVLAGALAFQIGSVYDGFMLLLKVGAGTGLIYILRWFWWRINATAEIVAMVASFALALGFFALGRTNPDWVLPDWMQFLIIVSATTCCWLAATFFGPKESADTLKQFYERTQPGGPGWKAVISRAQAEGELLEVSKKSNLKTELPFAGLGCLAIYSALFGTGLLLYGKIGECVIAGAICAICCIGLSLLWKSVISPPTNPPEGN
jgi:Na+/proline symporter